MVIVATMPHGLIDPHTLKTCDYDVPWSKSRMFTIPHRNVCKLATPLCVQAVTPG